MEVTTPYYEDLESYPDNQTAWPALSERDPTLKATSHAIKTYVIPVIGLLGVIGNTINVLILIKPGNYQLLRRNTYIQIYTQPLQMPIH